MNFTKMFVLMFYGHLNIWILLLSQNRLADVSAILTKIPENMAVESGQRVEMKCGSDSYQSNYLTWEKSYLTGLSTICSCGLPNQTIPFTCVATSNTTCSLYIDKVTEAEAGEYACSVFQTDPRIRSVAQLIVLAVTPECKWEPLDRVNATEFVEMSCSVTYTGSLAPVMTWFNPQGDELISTNHSTPGSADYLTSVTAQIPEVQSHSCNTNFTSAPPVGAGGGSYATNIPSYTSTCYTQSIIVQYPPFKENITIEGISGDIYLGSTLTCRGDTSPAVLFYEWSDDRGDTLGHNYTLSLDQTGQNLNYTCTACNLLGCNQLTITVNVVPVPMTTTATTDDTSNPLTSTVTGCNYLECNSVGLGVGLGLGLGIPLIISLVVNGYFIWKTRTKESNTGNKNSKYSNDADIITNLHEADQKLTDINEDQSHGHVNVNFSVTPTAQQNQTTALYEQLNSPTQQVNEYERLNN